MEFCQQDLRMLCSSIKHDEKMLQIKKRWLMGLPSLSRCGHRQRHTIVPYVLNDKSLSESLLRDEDVSAEFLKRAIEEGCGALLSKQEELSVIEESAQLFNTGEDEPSIIYRVVTSDLNNLNNFGLCRLTNILTGSSIQFEKTRPVMKKLIKRHLHKLFLESSYRDYIEPLSQIFVDQNNFRQDCRACQTLASRSLISTCKMVLERLRDFCTLTLLAMQRKLKGVKYVPQMKYRQGRSRKWLIKNVRMICSDMLVEQNEGEALLEPLAKAMTVAALSLKVSGTFDFFLPEFFYFPPETKAFQDEILKAIQALPKVRYIELKHVQHIIDPESEIPTKKFRSTLRKLLIEYLFECGDLDVPKTFRKALAFINRKSRRKLQCHFSHEKVEEEVERVLDVSAQLSQLMWDVLPEHTFDQEFADVFMEDSESDFSDSDGLDVNEGKRSNNYFNLPPANPLMNLDVNVQFSGSHSDDEVESIGDSRPNVSTLHFTRNESGGKYNKFSNEAPEPEKTNNQYLAIKDVSDEVSLVAHQLIGHLLEAFANIEDVALQQNVRSYCRGGTPSPEGTQGGWNPPKDSDLVLLEAVGEIIPSLTKSVSEKLKALGLQ
ncbi:hypothetical protein H6P81_009244 [Aristolochia fimbriata]|uniref:Uncharacterized protein n=1 Tax=Aristolochia fimbriata TaxID=158543 RepID=A0AAV7EKM3_ARIFI|nr:hypothetical protein H6P81_009244 [Aristolochia fimbriata]